MTVEKVLFSSVWKPIGPSVGDGEAVGYELLYGQVTRAQHIYSPRAVHRQFSLDYIAHNLETPSKVLHYPSKRRFIKEIRKGYDVVGISFNLSTAHHMQEMCKLIRKYSPRSKIVLGGYGTVMSEEELAPYCDAVCRGEGVEFMKRYLHEPYLPVSGYSHPEVRSRLRVFAVPVTHTAMVFAGLGCPNGCDFCCTSHFFNRKHIRLLDSGEAIFEVLREHQDKYPSIDHTILDEDFLLNKRRALGFLRKCRQEGRTFSIFVFASVKALSQYSFDELFEMGLDGVWIGYEGKQSDYGKLKGEEIDRLVRDLQSHGIAVLASMMIGIPYQSDEIARHEFLTLLGNRPAMTQYLIYGPTPGTPYYKRVMEKDLMFEDLVNDRRKYYKLCTGFYSMVKHPFMRRSEIEAMQKEFFEEDFRVLGPSIFRLGEVRLNGWSTYKDHENPLIRKKAEVHRKRLPPYLAGLPVGFLGPRITLQNRIRYIRFFFRILSLARLHEKLYALAAPIMGLGALLTWLNIVLKLFEHPFTRTCRYGGGRRPTTR